MAFNTGNPVPSTDARDLSDNAESIDQITNGTSTVTTRTGKVIKSIGPLVDTVDAAATQGLIDIAADVSNVDATATQAEIDILTRLNEVGVIYDSPIRPWSASLLVEDLRAHEYNGDIYIPKKALPFTTGATFNTDDWVILQGITNGDIANNISIVKVHQNVAAFKADTTEYPDGKTIHLNDRDADFIKITGTGTANTFDIIASTSVNQSISMVKGYSITSRSYGFVADWDDTLKTGTDNTSAWNALLLNSGKEVLISDGDAMVRQGDVAGNNIDIRSTKLGVLYKKPNETGILLNVTGSRNTISGLRLVGRNTQPDSGGTHIVNDIIRIEGNNNIVCNNIIDGSDGGGVSIRGGAENFVTMNTILDCGDNSILVANLGADRNIVTDNILNGTVRQNSIFITASSGSGATADKVYDNIFSGNICFNQYDIGIEIGLGTVRTLAHDNIITMTNFHAIIIRDAVDFNVHDNIIKVEGSQTDAIGVIPLIADSTFICGGKIHNNLINGLALTRSAIAILQNAVDVTDNTITSSTSVATPAIMVHKNAHSCNIESNKVRGYRNVVKFDDYFSNPTSIVDRLSIEDNKLYSGDNLIVFNGVDVKRSVIQNNTQFDNNSNQLSSDSGVNGNLSTVVRDNSILHDDGYVKDALSTSSFSNSFVLSGSLSTTGTVPVNQFSNATVVSGNVRSGTVTVDINNGEFSGIFAMTAGTITKLAGNIDAGAGGVTDFVVLRDAGDSQNVKVQRKAVTNGGDARSLKVNVSL